MQRTGEQNQLDFDGGPKYKDLTDPYYIQLPMVTGDQDRVYLTVAERVLKGRLRGTKSYQIVTFDFKSQAIDLSRKVEITSSLLVQIEKAEKRS